MPDPESGRLELAYPEGIDVRVPVEVRDAGFALVEETHAGEQVQLAPGSYVVSAVLPSGERRDQVVQVEAGSSERVTLTAPAAPPSPPTAPAPVVRSLERLGAPAEAPYSGPPWFLRFVPDPPGAGVDVVDVTAVGRSAEIALNLSSRGLLVTYVQLAAEGDVPMCLALPIAQGTSSPACELRVTLGDRLEATVSLAEVGKINGVAEYLARGYLKAATDVVGNAEELLRGKMADPIGAAVGAYALLRLGMLDRMHDWPTNLANWFEWLPDGAVIAGEQARRQEDHPTALAMLGLAVERGLPIFADGFSMLLSRLGEYARCDPRPEGVTPEHVRWAKEHAERLGALAPFVDFGSFVLSIRGADPGDPARTHSPLEQPAGAEGWRQFDASSQSFVEPTAGARSNPRSVPSSSREGTMFRIELLPAGNGDGLWIEYGDPDAPNRVLIDGGTEGTNDVLAERIRTLQPDRRSFELAVVTHIDGDHILGVLRYLQGELPEGLEFRDFWFNAWKHLPKTVEPLGPEEGEQLTRWLEGHQSARWNQAFGGDAVVVPEAGDLPEVTLPGGLKLTLLSPGPEQLRRLVPEWLPAVRDAGLDPETPRPPRPELPGPLERLGALDVDALAKTPFGADGSKPNGSSIVVLAELEGKSVLLAADAHAPVLVPALDRLLAQRGLDRLDLDAFKVSHHGSKANVSPDLLTKITCSRFLFSTNGSKTHHPNQEAVARILVAAERPSTLYFNYGRDEQLLWDDDALKERWEYTTVYPSGESGLAVDI